MEYVSVFRETAERSLRSMKLSRLKAASEDTDVAGIIQNFRTSASLGNLFSLLLQYDSNS